MYTQKKCSSSIYKYYLAMVCCITSGIYSWVPDNRYIPLHNHPRILPDHVPSLFQVDCMIATANKAFNDTQNEIGIPELAGQFDLGKLGQAFTLTGRPNLLPSFLQGISLPYAVEGKLQMQGIAFTYYQRIFDWLAVGASWMCMRVNTHQEFLLKQAEVYVPLTPSLIVQLDEVRRQMFQQLGFKQSHAAQVGFGDFDFFVRCGNMWEYMLKCRRIDAGLRVGVLMPSGERASLYDPSTIPFGGNGQWGWYLAADGLFELKEDMKVGLLLQLTKRIARTQLYRLPVLVEPYIFGATIGQVSINQGTTLTFSPYVIMENLRKGLGVGIQYTLTKHQEDDFSVRCTQDDVPVNLKQIREFSEWGSDYFTINVFYDFGKVKVQRSFDPIISFYWDIPSMLFVSKNILKTHKVSLGVGFSF